MSVDVVDALLELVAGILGGVSEVLVEVAGILVEILAGFLGVAFDGVVGAAGRARGDGGEEGSAGA